MAPKIAAGVTVVAGNMNPVTLVSTVVARNSAVQPGIRCDAQHAVQYDEAGDDADQADGDVQLGEGSNR